MQPATPAYPTAACIRFHPWRNPNQELSALKTKAKLRCYFHPSDKPAAIIFVGQKTKCNTAMRTDDLLHRALQLDFLSAEEGLFLLENATT
ncbi:MAG TPA: hypothetical protein PK198_27340, partial [Saprospiraceae bacterium]|nr:hypothetical protein [Saprospiraceae bacterium]